MDGWMCCSLFVLKGENGMGWGRGSKVLDHGANYTLGLLVLAAAACEIVSVGVGTCVAVFSECVAFQFSLTADLSLVVL